MSRGLPPASRAIRTAVVAALASALLSSASGAAGALSADAVGAGTLVAWLSGVGFEATIRGEIELAGTAVLGGETASFSVRGTFSGFGARRFGTFVSEGWVGYEAFGDAADGEAIEIRGLLYARRESLVPLRSGDVLTRPHRAAIRFRGETYRFSGAFSGTIEGGLEPAEAWGTIQFGGTGAVHLDDGSSTAAAPIPLDHPALPVEFLDYVARLDLAL